MNSPHIPIQSFYAYETTRLRDVMIPSDAFMSMVNYMEDADLELDFVATDKEGNKDKVWLVPYAFINPAKNLIIMEGDSIEDQLQFKRAQYNIILNRIEGFKYNALAESTMNYIDSDPDSRAIIHLSSGRVVPFKNSCVEDLSVINLKNKLPSIIEDIKTIGQEDDEDNTEPENYALNTFKKKKLLFDITEDQYRLMYCFKYVKEDPYNPKGVGLVSSHYTQSPYELTTGIDIATYVLDRFKKGAKIICII